MLTNLYQALDINFNASEAEILIALAHYLYKQGDQADAQVVADTKQWLLNEAARPLYDKQLLQEYPETHIDDDNKPKYLGIFFEIKDQVAMLQELRRAARELKNANEVLDSRISQLRSEEKIYRFPIRDRELLDINYQAFSRYFVNEGAKTVYFSLLQILARHRRPVRYMLYTESNGYSYIRYYEYTILKFKIEGRKKYLLARATPEELAQKGITMVEPSIVADGSIFRSRLLIDNKNPMYLEEAAIDHLIEEVLVIYDYAIDAIQTFNEASLKIKQKQVDKLLSTMQTENEKPSRKIPKAKAS